MPTTLNNAEMLQQLQDANALLLSLGINKPQNWDKMTPSQQIDYARQQQGLADQAGKGAQIIGDNAQHEQQMAQDIQQSGIDTTQMPMQQMASKKFNLKKAQMAPAAPAPAAQAVPQAAPAESQESSQFRDGADVKAWLEQIGDPNLAIDAIRKVTNSNQVVTDPTTHSSEEALGVIKDAINAFYSTKDEQERLVAASQIFDTVIPDVLKVQDSPNNGDIPSQLETGVKPNVAKTVDQINNTIKKLAEDQAKKTAGTKSFNLKKTAQHKTLENVMVFGPGQTKIDPFTGQLISDWHLVERNKGFGLKIDDVLNIDFETIWRNNIMDKYYSPYRDNDGNWVGGYIENRFEVDKNIPPLNNLQLKPGEKRKPYLPEYGPTEARLEAARTEMNKDRGYEPSEKGKVFNWKEASKKKVTIKVAASTEVDKMEKVATASRLDVPAVTASGVDEKTAQLKPLKPLTFPGEKKLNTESTFKCPACKSVLKPSATSCPNCHFVGSPIREDPKLTPDDPGRQTHDTFVQKGTMLPGHMLPYNAKASSLTSADAIFFDGERFIVYAEKKKEMFDTFEEAEAFKAAQVTMPLQLSTTPPKAPQAPLTPEVKRMPVKPKVNPVDIKKQRERHESASGLAIDG